MNLENSSDENLKPKQVKISNGNFDHLPNFSYHGGYRVLNENRARQNLKELLFDWLDTQFSTIIQVQIMQVAFTKCGRFAVVISKLPIALSFGIRLCTTNPYNQLSVYLLGISRTFESALLQSAKRIALLEQTIEEFDRIVQHGDVVCVHHLGYNHMAIYDAKREVFYELIGYIETGKDALQHEFMEVSSTIRQNALKITQTIKDLIKSIIRCLSFIISRFLCFSRNEINSPDENIIPHRQNKENTQTKSSQANNADNKPFFNYSENDKYLFFESPDSSQKNKQDHHDIRNSHDKDKNSNEIPLNARNTKLENSLLKINEIGDPDYVATAEDQLIGLDNEYPVINKFYASHSIAEVAATPKNIFLTRNPLLKMTVKKYADSYPPDTVILRARSALGHSGWNPITRNCEHFVSWAKTGRVESYQVHNFGSVAAIFGATILQLVILLSLITLLFFAYLKSFPHLQQFIYYLEDITVAFATYLFIIMSLIFGFGYAMSRYNGISGSFDRAL